MFCQIMTEIQCGTIPYMAICKTPVVHDLNKRMCVLIDQLLLTNRFGRKYIYDNTDWLDSIGTPIDSRYQ